MKTSFFNLFHQKVNRFISLIVQLLELQSDFRIFCVAAVFWTRLCQSLPTHNVQLVDGLISDHDNFMMCMLVRL